MNTDDNMDGTLIGERIREQMEKKGWGIKQLAESLDATYEHTRMVVRGYTVPSKYMLRALAQSLELDLKELEKLAVADRIRVKFGRIPLEISGKNPELEPIERVWAKLSEEHKADIVAMVQAFAKRDGGSHRK